MTDGTTVPTLRTPGLIAALLGVPLHRVSYLLRTRPHIRPVARAGSLRLYDQNGLYLLQRELERIEARKQRGAA